MKLFKKLLLVVVSLLAVFGLSGCKENEYVRVAVPENIDGINLYLTGKATGKQNVSNYVLFDSTDEYVLHVLEKMSKSYAGVDIAYVEVEDLYDLYHTEGYEEFAEENIKIVFIDSFDENGDIKSVWVARLNWMEKCPNYFPKFVKGLVKSNNYRKYVGTDKSNEAEYNKVIDHASLNVQKIVNGEITYKQYESYAQLKAALEAGDKDDSWQYKLVDFTDYNFTDYTNVYEYCAIYNIQNSKKVDSTNGVDDEFFDTGNLLIFKTNKELYDLLVVKHQKLNEFGEEMFTSTNNGGRRAVMYLEQNLVEKLDSNGNVVTKFVDEDNNEVKKSERNNEGVTEKVVYVNDHYTISDEGLELLGKVLNKTGLDVNDIYELVDLDPMLEEIYSIQNPTASKKKSKLVNAIIWSSGLLLFIGLVAFFLIRRRIKTGKRLLDIRHALDVDIESDLN